MVKLRITIPTYNRPEYIQRQVRDLLPQLREGVSIVVYDNCSEIPVETCFTQEELNCFEIVRNKTNIGGAANLGKCFSENADSDWIWLLSDDDKISNDAVSIVLETIENNKDCCYINFQQKRTQRTENFDDFLRFLTIIGAFGISFFQSACLFNMKKLKPYVRYYYDFASSWIAQIAMVIKYLEINKEEKCYFTTNRIIEDCNVGGWSPLDLIVNSSIFLDRFRHIKPIMNDTLFKALGDMDFTLLAQCTASFSTKRHYRKYIFRRFGFWNVLRYNSVTLCQYMFSVILPKDSFYKVKSIVAKSYNKRVKN